jgi:hypothetical protein
MEQLNPCTYATGNILLFTAHGRRFFFILIPFLFAICNNALSKQEEKNGGL